MRSCLPNTCGWLLLGLGIVVGVPTDAWAQGQLGTKEGLSQAYNANEALRNKLFSGETSPSPNDKAALKVADATAQWFIYRITHQAIDSSLVHKEFTSKVNELVARKNPEFHKMLGATLVESMKNVMIENVNKRPTIVVHAAMMLPVMAKLKQDSINAYLLALVADPKGDDVARLYALKALKEAMPITLQLDINSVPIGLDLTDAGQNAKRSSDAKLVDALVKFIEKPSKVDADTPYEEVEAIRYLRREAIIALAHSGSPAVLALKKPERKEGLVAPTLLRVLAPKGGLTPAPSLQEKIEAAHGLCAMKYPNMPEYEPALAVYLVGKTIEEFASEYLKDYAKFTAKAADRRLPRIAWKSESKRWEAGLKELALNASGRNGKKLADDLKELKEKATPLLKGIYQYNQPDITDFRNVTLPSLRPTPGYVFKSLKTPEIPLTD